MSWQEMEADLAQRAGMTVEAYRAETAARNRASLLAIAEHLSTSGRADPSGNTAATFRRAAARIR